MGDFSFAPSLVTPPAPADTWSLRMYSQTAAVAVGASSLTLVVGGYHVKRHIGHVSIHLAACHMCASHDRRCAINTFVCTHY